MKWFDNKPQQSQQKMQSEVIQSILTWSLKTYMKNSDNVVDVAYMSFISMIILKNDNITNMWFLILNCAQIGEFWASM